jgi:hypothetical protein
MIVSILNSSMQTSTLIGITAVVLIGSVYLLMKLKKARKN